MGVIISLYHQGRIIRKRIIDKEVPVAEYVVKEEIPEDNPLYLKPRTRIFLSPRIDLEVGDYVDVYKAEIFLREDVEKEIYPLPSIPIILPRKKSNE